MPLEERTLTVLGYMIGCWRRSGRDQEPHCNQYHDKSGRNQGKNTAIYGIHPNKVVTTLLGLRGGPARAKPGKIGVFPREGRRPGWFHPKHGVAEVAAMSYSPSRRDSARRIKARRDVRRPSCPRNITP